MTSASFQDISSSVCLVCDICVMACMIAVVFVWSNGILGTNCALFVVVDRYI